MSGQRGQHPTWKIKYDRMSDSHEKLQRMNQVLEDKLLHVVDKYEADRSATSQDISNLTSHLLAARAELNRLRQLNESYNRDLRLAVELLRCRPTSFVDQKLQSLPADIQRRVRSGSSQQPQQQGNFPSPSSPCSSPAPALSLHARLIRVPVPAPPRSSGPQAQGARCEGEGGPSRCEDVVEHTEDADQRVSAAILACVLEERRQQLCAAASCEPLRRRTSTCCYCGSDQPPAPLLVDVAAQTEPPHIGCREPLASVLLYSAQTPVVTAAPAGCGGILSSSISLDMSSGSVDGTTSGIDSPPPNHSSQNPSPNGAPPQPPQFSSFLSPLPQRAGPPPVTGKPRSCPEEAARTAQLVDVPIYGAAAVVERLARSQSVVSQLSDVPAELLSAYRLPSETSV